MKIDKISLFIVTAIAVAVGLVSSYIGLSYMRNHMLVNAVGINDQQTICQK